MDHASRSTITAADDNHHHHPPRRGDLDRWWACRPDTCCLALLRRAGAILENLESLESLESLETTYFAPMRIWPSGERTACRRLESLQVVERASGLVPGRGLQSPEEPSAAALTWNVRVGRVVVGVGALELGPSGTLADDHIVGLAAPFRLERQKGPVGGRLAGSHLAKGLASLDLGVDLFVRTG